MGTFRFPIYGRWADGKRRLGARILTRGLRRGPYIVLTGILYLGAGNEPAAALAQWHTVAGRLGRYNAVAILPQGAFDVQSIRTSQTTDPWAK